MSTLLCQGPRCYIALNLVPQTVIPTCITLLGALEEHSQCNICHHHFPQFPLGQNVPEEAPAYTHKSETTQLFSAVYTLMCKRLSLSWAVGRVF